MRRHNSQSVRIRQDEPQPLSPSEIEALKYQGPFTVEATMKFEPHREPIHIRAKDADALEQAHINATHYASATKNAEQLAELIDEVTEGVRADVIDTLRVIPEASAELTPASLQNPIKLDSALMRQLDALVVILSNAHASMHQQREGEIDHVRAAKRRDLLVPFTQKIFWLVDIFARIRDSFRSGKTPPEELYKNLFIQEIRADIDSLAYLQEIKPSLKLLNEQLSHVRIFVQTDTISPDTADTLLSEFHLPDLAEVPDLLPADLYRAAHAIRHQIVHKRFPQLQLRGELNRIPEIISYAEEQGVHLFENVDGEWLESLGISTRQLSRP